MSFNKTGDAPVLRVVKENEVEDLARETERRRIARLRTLGGEENISEKDPKYGIL